MAPTAASSPLVHRLRRLSAALAVVAVLVATLLAGATRGAATPLDGLEGSGGTAPADGSDLRHLLPDQALAWGVHHPFAAYVTGPVAEGTVTLADGATAGELDGVADGTFRFPALAGSRADTAGIDAAFAGSVRFLGHGDLLDLTLSDLLVHVDGDEGVLVADVTSRSAGTPTSSPDGGPPDGGPADGGARAPGEVVYPGLEVATLDLSGIDPVPAGEGLATWAGIPATLTDVAVPAFAGAYPGGTALDPISLTLAVADGDLTGAGGTPPSSAPAPAETPSTLDAPAVGAPSVEPAPVGALDGRDEHRPAALAAPAAVAGPTVVGAPVAVTGGYLDWGVKESFRTYITGTVARGTIEVSGGASTNADGTFRFPARAEGEFDPETSRVAAAFEGTVRFSGHGYHGPPTDLLQVTISNIRIDASSSGGTLIADVVSLPLEGGIVNPQPDVEPRTYRNVALGVLGGASPVAAGSDGASWVQVPATLTEAGVPAFADFYRAGAPLDPLWFTLTLSSVPDLPDGPGGGGDAPGDPGVTIDRSNVAPGGTITVTGEGFMAGEQVEVWITPEGLWVTTAVADAAGNVTASVTLPASITSGTHRLELRGISSGKTVSSASFTVGDGAGTGGGGGGGAAGRAGSRGPGAATMPRTGTDLSLAVAGGAFVLIGLALVAGARTRRGQATG